MDINSSTLGLVLEPHPLVNVSIGLDEAPFARCHIVYPITLVLPAVWPNLQSHAVTQPILCPLPLVDAPVVEFVRSPVNQLFV